MKVQDMAQNLYSDTRGQSERPVTFTEAVIDGLAAGDASAVGGAIALTVGAVALFAVAVAAFDRRDLSI